MISYQQALDLINIRAKLSPQITVPLAVAVGKIAASEVKAAFALPSFDNSAMDGFAVRLGDVAAAHSDRPCKLAVAQVTAAGDGVASLPAGYCVQIMTGAPVPNEADAVIPIENVDVTRDENGKAIAITVKQSPKPQQNIRRKGEDFSGGDVVLTSGTRLTPSVIMALAACGVGAVLVRAMPQIEIFATGNELCAVGNNLPNAASLYNSNSPYLYAACRSAGFDAVDHGIIGDNAAVFGEKLRSVIKQATTKPRIILSTGAVSKGDFDFIPAVLHELKADIVFHRVAIKPGKPILFAVLPNGDYFFGLPGNPVSTAVGLRFFVMPLVRALMGMPIEKPLRRILAESYASKSNLFQFLKAWQSENGQSVSILGGHESFRIKPMLAASGWVMLPEECATLDVGVVVDFMPMSLAE